MTDHVVSSARAPSWPRRLIDSELSVDINDGTRATHGAHGRRALVDEIFDVSPTTRIPGHVARC